MNIKYKLEHVQLEKAFFVPGYGELKGRTLNTQFYPGITMLMGPTGVDCELQRGGAPLTFFIPFSKIEIAVYAKKEEVAKEANNAKAA